MGRAIRSVLFVVIAAIALTCAALPAFAADDSRQTVKVGVYGNSIYAYQDENGIWRGIDIECLTNVAQREGLDLEFIDSVNDPDFLSSLENGTYDIVTDVVDTPERRARFLFSDTPLGSSNSVNLGVRADDERWDYGNIEQVSQMKIGLIESHSNDATFRAWCTERGLTPQFVEYDSVSAMSAALAAGEIDGGVFGPVFGEASQVKTILPLSPVNVYYIFRPADMALKNKVDQAMTQILLEDPYYLADLYSKYVVQRETLAVTFTDDERAYAAQHSDVTIAVMAHDEPYYWKTADGQDAGILPDYFALVAQQTGLNFKFAVYDTPDEEITAVKNGQADAVGLYANGIIFADRDELLITQNYASTNNVLLTRAGTSTDAIRSIAVNQRSADVVSSTLKADFSSADLKTYGSASECFSALESGSVDAIVCGLPSATWLMNQTNASNYSVTPLSSAPSEFCAAVNTGNRTLASLLSKGISMTKSSYDGIVTSDTLPATDLRTLVERIPPMWLAAAAGILLALVICLVIMMIQLRRRQRERAAFEAAKAANDKKELEISALEKSAEEKNRFFSNISHDMCTPLNAIIGFSEYAQDTDMSSQEKDAYFSKITTSGNLLLDLINDTLALSKMNSGKLELKLAPASTEEIGTEVTIPIREAAAQRGIAFTMDKSGYRPRTVMADALNLKKVLLNLLSNAVKYTPRGGSVWFAVVDDPAGSTDPDLVFTVRDTGIGISEEFLPHLFEPFATEGRAESESTGTGLGLSIVKNLVDLMGGTITVRSQVDVGTTFTVRLHLLETDAAVPEDGGDAAGGADGQLAGAKVLLCEDNAINAEVAGLILQKMGVAYDVAADGREGLERFEGEPAGTYDAILMDVRMPVMDGRQAARAIRALERPDAATIPIIALTADAFGEDVQRNIEAGMDDHLAKPISPERLHAVLAAQIGKHHAG